MKDNFYMDRPQYSYDEYSNLYPAHKVIINARKSKVRRANAESMVLNQTYPLDPFQQQMILDDARYRRQLMLQRDKEEKRRRRVFERNAYGALGSTASTAGKYFVSSLFQ